MDQLDEIRQKIDIVELISPHVALKKAGRNFKGLCPFHSEKTPSFIVSPERQIFKCFGCSLGGDAFKFLMEMEGMEFREAVQELAKRAGVELKDFRPSKDQQQKQKLLEINHLASEYFQFILLKHPVGQKARQYLEKRGIVSSSIKTFALGYAPDSWEGLLNWLVGKKGYRYQDLEAAGLAIKSRGWYARFRGRIIFPLMGTQGDVLGFAGRVLQKDVKQAKYINSPETLLYHKSRHLYGLSVTKEFVRKKNQIVLVEGELDAISSYQAGVKQIAAIKGSALTEDHLKLIKRFCETIILSLDADQAGQMAMQRSLDLVEKAGLNLKMVDLPSGKDPDDLAQKDPKKWRQTVKTAVSIYDFVIDSAVKRFGKVSPESKRKVSAEVVPWLSKIENEVVKSHFIKKLALVLGVEEEAVAVELTKQGRKQELSRQPIKESPVKPSKSRRERLEDYLLALVVQADNWQELIPSIDSSKIEGFGITKIVERLKKTGKQVKIAQFAQSLPAQLQAVFDTAFLQELSQLTVQKRQEEMERTINKLEKLQLYDRLSQLRGKLKTTDQKKKNKVLTQINQVIKRLQLVNHD